MVMQPETIPISPRRPLKLMREAASARRALRMAAPEKSLIRDALRTEGLCGPVLLDALAGALRTQVLFRGASDPITLVGPAGSGRHAVAEAIHQVVGRFLNRTGPMVTLFPALQHPSAAMEQVVQEYLAAAAGGTLVLDALDALSPARQEAILRLVEVSARHVDHTAFVLVIAPETRSKNTLSTSLPVAQIHLPALITRRADRPDLIAGFIADVLDGVGRSDVDITPADPAVRAFAADPIAEASISVAALRERVRGVVFTALDADDVSLDAAIIATLKDVSPDAPSIPSSMPRAELPEEGHCDKGDAETVAAALSLPGTGTRTATTGFVVNEANLQRLATLHGIPTEMLRRQVDVLSELREYMDGLPKSYANTLERSEDIKRVALWLLTGAETQASFRRWFGDAGHLQPSKSVAWAFFNRVTKRDA